MAKKDKASLEAAPLTIVQLGYLDFAETLDAFGTMGKLTTAGDVQQIHAFWHSIPEGSRHLVALCFHHFDGNRNIFDLPAEEAAPRPPVPGLDDLPRAAEEATHGDAGATG